MKKIEVEPLFQNKDSKDCGPVCTQMALKHFGLESDLQSLIEKLSYDDAGTFSFDNGMILLNSGLKVTCITAQPYLFSPDIKLSNIQEITEHLTKKIKDLPKFEKGIGLFKDFINTGGELKIEIPNIEHIKNAIDNESIVIALIYGKALGSNEGGFHFVIVNGYDEKNVYITNPLPTAKSGWYSTKNFMYALHSSTVFDIDNGSLLIVSK
jgi:ABC-type bacteriocin/lantibiotic exporter with double-glycine peptidase domain